MNRRQNQVEQPYALPHIQIQSKKKQKKQTEKTKTGENKQDKGPQGLKQKTVLERARYDTSTSSTHGGALKRSA